MARRDQDEFEVVDQDDEDEGESRVERRDRRESRDDSQFDPLDRNIQFPDDEDEQDDPDRGQVDDDEDEESEDDEERDERAERRGRERNSDDDEGENESWRRRLARERRLREEAEADADEYQNRFERIEKTLADIKNGLESGKSTAELDAKLVALNGKLKDLQVALRAAIEAGDADKQVDLNSQISDAKAEIKLTEYQKTQVKKVDAATTDAQTPQANRHLTRWMRQHGRLYRDNSRFKALAISVSKDLVAEGVAGTSAAHFEQLDKELAKFFPQEFPNIKKAGKEGQRRNRQAVESGDEGNAQTRRQQRGDGTEIKVRGRKAILTKKHEEIMRKVGMDPANKRDREIFVRENL